MFGDYHNLALHLSSGGMRIFRFILFLSWRYGKIRWLQLIIRSLFVHLFSFVCHHWVIHRCIYLALFQARTFPRCRYYSEIIRKRETGNYSIYCENSLTWTENSLRNKSCSTIWMYTEQAKEISMFLDLSLMRSCHDMVKQMDILNIYLQLLE